MTSSLLRRVRSLRRRYAMRLDCGASGGGRAQLFVRARDAQCAMQGVHVGLFCSTPAVELSRSVNTKLAMEMLLTGEPITADRAREAGLVNRVVDGDEAALDEEVGWRASTQRVRRGVCVQCVALPCRTVGRQVASLAATILSKSGSVIAMGKHTFYKQLSMGIEPACVCGVGVVAMVPSQSVACGFLCCAVTTRRLTP